MVPPGGLLQVTTTLLIETDLTMTEEEMTETITVVEEEVETEVEEEAIEVEAEVEGIMTEEILITSFPLEIMNHGILTLLITIKTLKVLPGVTVIISPQMTCK